MAGYDAEDDEVMLAITPRKFRKWDILAVGMQTLGCVAGNVSDALTDVAGLLLRHSEWEQQRHTFHEESAFELETLIAEVEGMD